MMKFLFGLIAVVILSSFALHSHRVKEAESAELAHPSDLTIEVFGHGSWRITRSVDAKHHVVCYSTNDGGGATNEPGGGIACLPLDSAGAAR